MDVLDIEQQQEQAQTNERSYSSAQQEGVTTLALDHWSNQKLHEHFSGASAGHQDSSGTTFVVQYIFSEGQHGGEHTADAQAQHGRPDKEEHLAAVEDQQQALDQDHSHQTKGDQPVGWVPVGQVDESQSACCNGSPEYAVQIASGLMCHKQRRGHSIGVDEACIRAYDAISDEDNGSAHNMEDEESGWTAPEFVQVTASEHTPRSLSTIHRGVRTGLRV